MTAIYCPATLDLMRKHAHRGLNAVAEMLGWPVERTASVARRHGIELLPMTEAPVVASPSIAPGTPPPAKAMGPKPAPAADVPLRQWAKWSQITGTVTSPFGTVKLRKSQARVFDALWRAKEPMVGSDLAQVSSISPANVSAFTRPLSADLRPIGIAIQGIKGRDGGYVLVKVPS